MHYLNKISLLGLIALNALAFPLAAEGEMTSANYYIYADSIGYNGGSFSSSTNYTLTDTNGEIASGSITGGTYTLVGGFQAANLDENLSFLLTDTSLNLGTLSDASVSSATTSIVVACNSASGYTVSVSDVSGTIASTVVDGTVTAGVNEYGVNASGGNAVTSGDVAVTNGLVIASANTQVLQTTTTIAFKASYDAITAVGGSYNQAVTFTASANF